MNKFFRFFVAFFAISTLCFSFVSCGDDDNDGPNDEGTENYTLYYSEMIPSGLLKIGTVDFTATNPETGKEEGFTLPDNYGNDYEASSFSPINEYLNKVSFGTDLSKYYVRYILAKGKTGQNYSMTATFKIFDKEKIAALENQDEVIQCGSIALNPIGMTSKGVFKSFDLNNTTSLQSLTIASLVENYDRFKDRWNKTVSKSGKIE